MGSPLSVRPDYDSTLDDHGYIYMILLVLRFLFPGRRPVSATGKVIPDDVYRHLDLRFRSSSVHSGGTHAKRVLASQVSDLPGVQTPAGTESAASNPYFLFYSSRLSTVPSICCKIFSIIRSSATRYRPISSL
jgi:hypothetical protein